MWNIIMFMLETAKLARKANKKKVNFASASGSKESGNEESATEEGSRSSHGESPWKRIFEVLASFKPYNCPCIHTHTHLVMIKFISVYILLEYKSSSNCGVLFNIPSSSVVMSQKKCKTISFKFTVLIIARKQVQFKWITSYCIVWLRRWGSLEKRRNCSKMSEHSVSLCFLTWECKCHWKWERRIIVSKYKISFFSLIYSQMLGDISNTRWDRRKKMLR